MGPFRLKSLVSASLILAVAAGSAQARGWRKGRVVVGGNRGPALTNVPPWAAEAMRNADRPLPVRSSGRRPWAYALSHVNTPTTALARYYADTLIYR
jgi:hypothetical protein